MPCYAVRTVTMELRAADPVILRDALKLCGFPYSDGLVERIIANGEVRVRAGNEYKIDQIRRTYAEKVVETAARRFGFQVNRKAQRARGETVLSVTRR